MKSIPSFHKSCLLAFTLMLAVCTGGNSAAFYQPGEAAAADFTIDKKKHGAELGRLNGLFASVLDCSKLKATEHPELCNRLAEAAFALIHTPLAPGATVDSIVDYFYGVVVANGGGKVSREGFKKSLLDWAGGVGNKTVVSLIDGLTRRHGSTLACSDDGLEKGLDALMLSMK